MTVRLFTSESVTEGHPDKICDQISDAILDACLRQDPESRVAVESLAKTGMILVAGELTTKAQLDIPAIVRLTLRSIGYTNAAYGIDADTCAVLVHLDKQSPDIALGVNHSGTKEQGAGDQGLMFGYATNETPEFMPLSIQLAHALAKRLAVVRKNSILDFLRPDGKTQVTVEYHDDVPKRVDTIVVSSQHEESVDTSVLRKAIQEHVINPVCSSWIDAQTKIFINPTGRFVRGGPYADTGLTGRKIIVDSYGGYARHGGGAFSGKDPSKVDRSAAYAARYIAKNIVAAGLAKRCEIQLAYAIGVAAPVSLLVDTFGTGNIPDTAIAYLVQRLFPLKPAAIIQHLELNNPVYQETAAYGHFGRDVFRWEKTDFAETLAEHARVRDLPWS